MDSKKPSRLLVITAAVFSRPPLAAFIVGSSIHLFSMLNASLVGTDYIAGLMTSIEQAPFYGMGKFLIPFIVPGIVTLIGKHLSRHRQQELIGLFPEMNPDIVLKVNEQGDINYANPSASAMLQKLNFEGRDLDVLLPPEYKDHVGNVRGIDTKIHTTHSVGGVDIEYTIRGKEGNPSVFISGHDATHLHDLQRHLNETQSRSEQLTDFFGATLAECAEQESIFKNAQEGIIKTLMSSENINSELWPTHVFLAEFKDGLLRGHVYRGSKDDLIKMPEEVIIDPSKDHYVVLQNIGHLYWSNWEDEGGSIEPFQERFHPTVRKHIGTIARFATYNTGRVALVAYYQGRKITELDAKVLKGLAVYASGLHRISQEQASTEEAFIYTVNSLARASEANDEDTGDHIVRINEYSRAIAEAMDLPDEFVRTIHYSAQMHDVGKIHVNPAILKKPGKLTDEEFAEMKSHPVYGAKILGDSKRLSMAAEIALGHHEKYNGRGYPNGLSGEDIPLSARIVSITDVYDALRQARVYKPAFSHEKAMEIITKGDGRTDPAEFDPKVLAAFVSINAEMARIFDQSEI